MLADAPGEAHLLIREMLLAAGDPTRLVLIIDQFDGRQRRQPQIPGRGRRPLDTPIRRRPRGAAVRRAGLPPGRPRAHLLKYLLPKPGHPWPGFRISGVPIGRRGLSAAPVSGTPQLRTGPRSSAFAYMALSTAGGQNAAFSQLPELAVPSSWAISAFFASSSLRSRAISAFASLIFVRRVRLPA